MVERYSRGQTLEGIVDALAPRRKGFGLTIPQRLRLVALRLEAGLRETPERFYPFAHFVLRFDTQQRRRFLFFLASEALHEASSSGGCSPVVLDLLERACHHFAGGYRSDTEERQQLTCDILAAERPKRRRRHVHCHGQITADRWLLLLRGLVTAVEAETFRPYYLAWTIAYAMADYDYDHFVMKGPAPAQRVRRLIDWLEQEMPELPTRAGDARRSCLSDRRELMRRMVAMFGLDAEMLLANASVSELRDLLQRIEREPPGSRMPTYFDRIWELATKRTPEKVHGS